MNCTKLAEAVGLREPFNERWSTCRLVVRFYAEGPARADWRRAPTAHYLFKLVRRGSLSVGGKFRVAKSSVIHRLCAWSWSSLGPSR